MAPAHVPVTPEQKEYHTVKTPDNRAPAHDAKAGESAWGPRYRVLGNVAQFLILGCIFLYIFGQFAYFSDVYNVDLTATFKSWWGVPKPKPSTGRGGGRGGGGGGAPKGHSEMVLPTFFFIFTVLPVIVSVLLLEFLRHYNLRRISGQFMLKIAMILRRKPSFMGKVSYWSYGEWIFFLFAVGGNIFVFARFFHDKYKTGNYKGRPFNMTTTLEVIGLTFGYNCTFCMAFLFLPATRNCVWMEFFNISYANGIKYHRWFGVLTIVTGVLHCVGYYWAWIRNKEWRWRSLPCFDCELAGRIGYHAWMDVFGEIALILLLIIGFTSIPYIRRKFYNLFYYSHQLLFPAVVFSVMHWVPIVWWVLPTFLLYCISRAVSVSNAFSPVEVAELSAISDDLVKVVIKRSPGRDGHYRVGQFLYLNVPAISKLQWHAFTISSSPRTSPTTVTVLLKSLGDWTQELVTYANDCKQKNVLPTIYVDGFYGASLEMYDEYSTICLVGGGIGATPMFAILEDLAAKLSNHETIKQKVVFVFSFREVALLEEVHLVLMRLRELDPQEQYFKTHFYLTRVPSDEVLNQPVDAERLQGKHIQPTQYETNVTPIPFFEPLRSRTYKSLMMLVAFAFTVVFVVYLEYGNGKIKNINGDYWMIQQFVEPMVVVVGGVVAFVFIIVERYAKQKSSSSTDFSKELNVFQAVSTPAMLVGSDVHTHRDLLSHYNVTIGQRPDTKNLLLEAYELHKNSAVVSYGKPVIGVFVSGPEAMKRAVDYAVAEIGTSHFDIHDEEFEL